MAAVRDGLVPIADTVIQRLTGDSMGRITRATLPFFFIMSAFVLIIALFPGIIGFLPETMRGR
jgi:TRAP-type C4-dicarboxylate transport system permease large subunit